jgi:hypothetical protein
MLVVVEVRQMVLVQLLVLAVLAVAAMEKHLLLVTEMRVLELPIRVVVAVGILVYKRHLLLEVLVLAVAES